MSRVWTIVRKEFIHILRDLRTLALVIILPVMLLLFLGLAVANDIENIPLAVADQSKTDVSRQLIDQYVASGYFQVTYQADSEAEIMQLMDRGVVHAGLVIPEDLGRKLSTGESSQILFFIDGTDPIQAQTAQLAAETVGQAVSQRILVRQLEKSPLHLDLQLPVDVRMRFLYNPDMRRMNFFLPGLVGLILQVQALLLTAFAIVREREQGTLEQLIVTPIKSWELMLGKLLPFIFVAVINLFMVVATGVLVFHMPLKGDIFLLMLLSGIFLIGSLGMGILISNISHTQIEALYLAVFIVLPAAILSGLLFPRQSMPWPAYFAGYLLPLTYFLEIVRGIILKGVGLNYLWPWVWPMALFSIVVFLLSVVLFRKRIS
ncbi:MAG: ABC transporter permease [Bellilinea sp.]|jgi:ABC-2 type transport system permease protein